MNTKAGLQRLLPLAGMVAVLMLLSACSFERPRGAETPRGTDQTAAEVVGPGATNRDGAEVIYIPPTTFRMGAAVGDPQARADEQPAHSVSLAGFYIYAREVTNRMYAECVRAGACFPVQPLPNGPTSHYNDPAYADYPVVGVDWNMARDYCRWAGGRLPTEAEWELAARGAEGFLYPWGNDPGPACDRLNMFGCLVPPDTQPVGSYSAGISPYGLFDMSGNVWEWVNDWYDANYYAASAAANPLGPSAPPDAQRPFKVVRGGGWTSYPQDVRATARARANPNLAYEDVGFRCVAQAESWPAGLTLPAAGHGLPESSGPSPVGARVGDGFDLCCSVNIQGMFSTCPDSQGNVHVHILFNVSEEFDEHARFSGALYYANSADTGPCQYDPAQHLLSCSGPAERLETRRDAFGDSLYVVQVCLINRANNQVVSCEELLVQANRQCPGNNWMTGCDVACNEDHSLDLVCKSNDPAMVQWVDQQWTSVWNVAQPLNHCTPIFEPAGQPAQAVTLVCSHNFLQPDASGNLVFDFCGQTSCPYSVTIPYPANCPIIGAWQASYGCQDGNLAFINLDTGLPDAWSLLDGYQVGDCEHAYACVPIQGHPGWVYCNGPAPSWECPVTACLTLAGVERCQVFERAGFLPCRAPQQPEEPQQPADPCNRYTTPETCKDHSLPPENCTWDYGQQICKTKP